MRIITTFLCLSVICKKPVDSTAKAGKFPPNQRSEILSCYGFMTDSYLDEKHSERKCVCKSMTKGCSESEHSLIMLWESMFLESKSSRTKKDLKPWTEALCFYSICLGKWLS